MIPKKNPKADLARNSGLFFALGMAVVLFLSWKGLEWKKYDKKEFVTPVTPVEDFPGEKEVPVIDLNTPPPPPPPPAVIPPDFEPEDNNTEKKESPIMSSDDVLDDPVDIDDIPVTDDETISITLVENVPVFPGCEDAEDRLKCFQEKMISHVRKNFHYPEPAQERGIEGKVYVAFIIDKEGNITGVKMRGPDQSLEKEAERIINKLPKMTPGKQGSRAVRVPFSIPITFKLQ